MSKRIFIIGAAKSGSTSLYAYLKQHPDIHMSPIKETNFFAHKDIHPEKFNRGYKKKNQLNLKKYFSNSSLGKRHIAFIRNQQDYDHLFRENNNEVYFGEASTSYLWSESAANKIKDTYPDAKIILVLRNPIDRAYSHWQMDVRAGTTQNDFLEAIKSDIKKQNKGWGISHLYKELGMYSQQVERYLDIFPENQIMLLLSEDIWGKEKDIVERICIFLGIKNIDNIDFGIKNIGGVPRYPIISKIITILNLHGFIRDYFPKIVLEFLQNKLVTKARKINTQEKTFCKELYKDDIKRLEKIISRELDHWLY